MNPRVVILSGWGYPASAWDAVVRALPPTCRCRVHEATPPPTPTPWFEEDGPDAGAEGPRILVGWSLGAIRALRYAASSPGLHGLLLLSATARFCADTRAEGGADAAVLRAMAAGLRRDLQRTLGAFYARCAAPHPPPSPAQCAAWIAALRSDVDDLTRGLRDLAELDLRNPPPGVTAPTILLHGAEDRIVRRQAARALAASLPRARLEVAPGAGHDLPIRHPDLVADCILRLLGARISAPAPFHAPAES